MIKTYLLLGFLLVLTIGLVVIYFFYVNPLITSWSLPQSLSYRMKRTINEESDISWEFKTDLPINFNKNQFKTLATTSGLLSKNNIFDYDTRTTYKPSSIVIGVFSAQDLNNLKMIESYQGKNGKFFGYTITRTNDQTNITFYFSKAYINSEPIETVLQDISGLVVNAFYYLGKTFSLQRVLTIEEKQQLGTQTSKVINQYELIFK